MSSFGISLIYSRWKQKVTGNFQSSKVHPPSDRRFGATRAPKLQRSFKFQPRSGFHKCKSSNWIHANCGTLSWRIICCFSVVRVLKNYVLLVLFTAGPLISAYTAECIATAFGSKVDEAGAYPCIIHGVDVGLPLNIMFTLGLFGLMTIPIGSIALFVYTSQQLEKLFPRMKHKLA